VRRKKLLGETCNWLWVSVQSAALLLRASARGSKVIRMKGMQSMHLVCAPAFENLQVHVTKLSDVFSWQVAPQKRKSPEQEELLAAVATGEGLRK